jgi:cyclic pyranopterin phosphate synthase
MAEDIGLVDPYGRNINSLRVSITHRCNFNCFFCHGEGESGGFSEATLDEIEAVVSTAANLGVRRVKITGGEPLLRGDLVEIVSRISPLVDEISMTTNGVGLTEKACELKEAGLKRVNVSLHSADSTVFRKVVGVDSLDEVKRGIEEAQKCGLYPIKLNMVVMRGVNEAEVPGMIEYSKSTGAILQLIEYQALERGVEGYGDYHYDLRPLEEELAARSERIVERKLHRRKQYWLRGGGAVEVVRPMHNSEFCSNCTRLRLTSDGHLKPCLMREDNHVEAVQRFRQGGVEALVDAFREAVALREPYWRK